MTLRSLKQRSVILGLICFSSLLSFAQNISCSQSGNAMYCSDGTSATRSGNTLYFNNGTTVTRSGNSVYINSPPPTTVVIPRPAQQQQSWNVSLDKAIRDIHPQMLAGFIKECMSVPQTYREQYARNRKMFEDGLTQLDTWPVPEDVKQQTRANLQKSIREMDAQPVPEFWRIDTADDFQECLDANERDWRITLALGKRHRDYFEMDDATQRANAEYLLDHYGNPRFLVYTLQQREETYYSLKTSGKFRVQRQ